MNNRRRLRELFSGTAPIVLTANGVLQRIGDTTFPFEQDRSFWYLTGLDEPDILLVLDKDKEYLILPPKGEHQLIFDTIAETQAIISRSGIKTVLDSDSGWKQLKSRLSKVKHVATMGNSGNFIESHGFYTNPARQKLIKTIQEAAPAIQLLDLREHLSRMRVIKQPVELEAIQQAIDITGSTLKKVMKKRDSYNFEYEIEAAITYEFKKNNSNHAFAPIIASGKNACTLHYLKNDAMISKDGLLITDIGAEFDHYAADITRTFALQSPTKRQRAVFEAVADVQQFAMSLLKPGTLPKEYEQAIEQYMGETLRKLGLIKIINHQNVRKYAPHSTSHFLGLDVHDAGDYRLPLEENSVLTVEPGIYIPEEGIGVRIEDDVLVTAKGIKILSNKLSRELW